MDYFRSGFYRRFYQNLRIFSKKFTEWKEMGIKLYPDCSTGDDYAEFYTEDMDVAIKAGFTVTIGDDKDIVYLLTDTGREVKVPKEKLGQ